MIFSFQLAVLCFLAATFWVHGGDVNQTKAVCFSGSSLYQRVTQNCNEKNPDYVGTWYCAKMEICESFISSARECIETRGCATQEECTTSSGTIYNGETVESVPSTLPAGMTMKATCCMANNFPDDDTIALDYKDVCNSASKSSVGMLSTAALIVVGVVMSLFL